MRNPWVFCQRFIKMEGGDRKGRSGTRVQLVASLLRAGEANQAPSQQTPQRGRFILLFVLHFAPVHPHVLPLQFGSQVCVLDNVCETFENQIGFEDS